LISKHAEKLLVLVLVLLLVLLLLLLLLPEEGRLAVVAFDTAVDADDDSSS